MLQLQITWSLQSFQPLKYFPQMWMSEQPPPPLEQGLAISIARQTEAVFSDTALGRDSFLLKHVRRNR